MTDSATQLALPMDADEAEPKELVDLTHGLRRGLLAPDVDTVESVGWPVSAGVRPGPLTPD